LPIEVQTVWRISLIRSPVLGEFAGTSGLAFEKYHGNAAAKRTDQEKRAVVPAGHIVPMARHRLTPDGIEHHCNKRRTRAASARDRLRSRRKRGQDTRG